MLVAAAREPFDEPIPTLIVDDVVDWEEGLAWSGFFGRPIRAQFGGIDVWTFSPEDSLLALAAHGTRREWRRPQMVCDVAGHIRSTPALDRGTCLDRVAGLGDRRHGAATSCSTVSAADSAIRGKR